MTNYDVECSPAALYVHQYRLDFLSFRRHLEVLVAKTGNAQDRDVLSWLMNINDAVGTLLLIKMKSLDKSFPLMLTIVKKTDDRRDQRSSSVF